MWDETVEKQGASGAAFFGMIVALNMSGKSNVRRTIL